MRDIFTGTPHRNSLFLAPPCVLGAALICDLARAVSPVQLEKVYDAFASLLENSEIGSLSKDAFLKMLQTMEIKDPKIRETMYRRSISRIDLVTALRHP